MNDTLSVSLSHACDLGHRLIALLQEHAFAYVSSDYLLPDSIKQTMLRFLQVQSEVKKLIQQTAKPLDSSILSALETLQTLTEHMSTAALDQLIATQYENSEYLYQRASLLVNLGRDEPAMADYLSVLNQQPGHFGALNDLAKLQMEKGNINDAHALLSKAVKAQPELAIGHLNLGDILLCFGNYPLAKHHYQIALQIEPDLQAAHQGLALAFAGLGDQANTLIHQQLGFNNQAVIQLEFRGNNTPIPIVVLSSAFGGNTPIKHTLDKRVFQTTILLVEYYQPDLPLPEHQLVVNLIGDADLCHTGLNIAEQLLQTTVKPVINHPALIQLTTRLTNAYRLRGLADVITPNTQLLPKSLILAESAPAILASYGIHFPLLLRSPGHHTGQFFMRVECPEQLSEACNGLPDQEVLVMEMLDARNQNGDYHKYRVMFIDGKLYPLHLAISKHWKVHYFSADMADNLAYRQLEQAFLQNMPAVLGEKVINALESICFSLALDYAGVDFAVNVQGDVLLFETNATMVVQQPEQIAKWAYRQAAVQNILSAVRKMLIERATQFN